MFSDMFTQPTDHRPVAKKIKGPLVPVLAAFDAAENLDIDSTCKWVDWLIKKGIKLFWTTQGTTHFMCLSDQEIMDLTKALAAVISGRGIFIASTAWNWNMRECRKFVDYAAKCGVNVVKLQLDWRWNPDHEQVFEFYRKIAESACLPLFAYTAGAGGISADLLKRILDLPQFIGMKNDTDDFAGHQNYLRVIGKYRNPAEFVVMTGGGMNCFLYGSEFGARAYADTVGWFAPEQAIAFSKYMEKGMRRQALQIIKDWEEPMQEHLSCLGVPLWSWAHTVLQLMNYFKSNQLRFPLKTLKPEQVKIVRKYLEKNGLLPG